MADKPDGKVVYQYVGDTSGIDKANDEAEKKIRDSAEKIESTASGSSQKAADAAADVQVKISDSAQKVSSDVGEKAAAVTNTVKSASKAATDAVGDQAQRSVAGVTGPIEKIIAASGNGVAKIISGAKAIPPKIGSVAEEVADKLKARAQKITEPVKNVADKVASTAQMVKSKVTQTVGDITSNVKSGIDKLTSPVKAFGDKVKAGITNVGQQIKTGGREANDAIKSALGTSSGNIGAALSSAADKAKSTASSIVSTIKSAASSAASSVKSAADQINTKIKSSGEDSGAEVSKAAESSGSSLKDKLGGAAAATGLAIGGAFTAASAAAIAFGKKGVDLASDLTEVQNVVDTAFGSNASKVDAFAQSAAENFGESELQAKKYASTLGSMIKSMGLSGDATEQMSTKLTGLAGDFASFYNLNPDDAFEKIRAGIAGETEPLKELGINMDQTNLQAFAMSQGITTSVDKMSQAQLATLRYNYLLSVSKDAQGDFAKTSGSFANQQRILAMEFDSLAATIGQTLLPVLTQAMGYLTKTLSDPSIANGLKGFFTQIVNIAQQALPSLIKAMQQIAPTLGNVVSGLLPVLLSTLTQILPPVMQLVQALLPTLVSLISTLLPPIVKIVQEIMPALVQILNTLLPPLMQILQAILPPLLSIINAILPPVLQIIQVILPPLISLLKSVGDVIKILAPIISWLAGIVGDVLGRAFKDIEPIIDNAIGIFSHLIAFVRDVFTGNWRAAWQDVQDIFKNLFGALGGIVKLPLNIVIDGIDSFIDGLDKIQVPDWVPGVGGKGINIPRIPHLASGGVAYGPQLAMIGDNPHASVDPEIVAPLSKLKDLVIGALSTAPSPSFSSSSISNSKSVVQNFYGPVNLADKGSAAATLQQTQFVAPV